jgi:hypothetical protein
MTRSTAQRLAVWRGDRKRTSGGLRKSDLTKNARGKIVSKKKSEQASKQNNLGDKLRKKGVHVAKDQMLHPKGAKKKVAAKPRKAVAAPKPKPKKKVDRPQPKKVAPKKAPAKKKVVPLASRTDLPTARKVKKGYNPLTNQPYGPTGKGKVTLDNVKTGTRASRKAASMRASAAAQQKADEAFDFENVSF